MGGSLRTTAAVRFRRTPWPSPLVYQRHFASEPGEHAPVGRTPGLRWQHLCEGVRMPLLVRRSSAGMQLDWRVSVSPSHRSGRR